MKRVVILITGLMLLMALAAFAQGTSQATKAKAPTTKAAVAHQAMGTISSVEAGKLVLTRTVKGKREQTTFMLNDQTKKDGDLKAGEKVTVRYKVEKGQDIATSVKAAAVMAKASKPKK